MPKSSIKRDFLETLSYFGLQNVLEPDKQNLEDEELLFLMAVTETKRYCVEKPYKPLISLNQWWNYALFDTDFNPDLFKCHFRMTKSLFWELHHEIKGFDLFSKHQESISLQLAVALYRFGSSGNAASLKQVASKFNIGEGSVSNFTNRVVEALTKLSKKYIRWPTPEERKIIGEMMTTKLLPKCIGFVDGTDVPFAESPTENKEVYWSRKKRYCMQVQIICDPCKVIRDVFTGYPGSVHDAKVFSLSTIGLHPEKYFSDGEYLIGDSAYSLTETMVVPYRRTQIGLSPDKKKFNRHISSERVKVEHVIGILKGRFQSLNQLRITITPTLGHKKACEWILACSVLHNFLADRDEWTTTMDMPVQVDDEYTGDNTRRGYFKRQAVFEIFNTMSL